MFVCSDLCCGCEWSGGAVRGGAARLDAGLVSGGSVSEQGSAAVRSRDSGRGSLVHRPQHFGEKQREPSERTRRSTRVSRGPAAVFLHQRGLQHIHLLRPRSPKVRHLSLFLTVSQSIIIFFFFFFFFLFFQGLVDVKKAC